jgi:hypothetical protein
VAGNRAVTAHTSEVALAHRKERSLSRALAMGLLFCLIALLNTESLRAGCHYSNSSRAARALGSSEQQSASGHVRHIHFLGQWIYEAGEIKYVPWQGSPPCQGNNCQANDDSPVTSSLPPYRNARTVSSAVSDSVRLLDVGCRVTLVIEAQRLRAFAGYPHEFEYPP